MSRTRNFVRGRGAWVTLATVLGLAVAMGATVLGLGATDHALATSNASLWMWSASRGEIARVNAETGRVDTRYKVIDAQGHVIQVSQTDRYLILRDLTTGQISSLDLATLQVAATSQSTPGLGVTVVLSGDAGFIIDAVQGVVRQLDPLTLTPTGQPLSFPPGLSGGAFDGNGTLWLLVPTEGTVVGIRPAVLHPAKGVAATTSPSIAQTVAVADPGHDLTMSTLDNGVAVLDQTGDKLTTVRGAQKHTLNVPMSGAGTMPAQTGGSGANLPVTVEDNRHVYVVNNGHVTDFAVPGSGGTLSPAVPFAGRFYVADNASGTVYVLDATGTLINTIAVPHAGGSLELQVKTDHLFINAPNSSTARVVDNHNRVKVVDKYANNVLGGDPPPNPPPPPPPPPVPPVGPPGAPTHVSAVAGNASAHITWGAAAANGSTVTKYVVEGDGGAPHEVGAKQRSLDVGGLVNGHEYRFTVYAVNAKGAGPKRAANPVVPTSDVPDPPTSVTAQEQKNGSVVVHWPAANGQGHKIVQYSIATVSGGAAVDPMTSGSTTLTIPAGKLAYGTQYAFTVTAVNDRGASSKASPTSNSVVPYTVPTAPKGLSAQTVDAKGAISVSWQPALDNGRQITKYVVSAGGKSQDVTGATSVTLSGFADGATVQVSVKAVNLAGDGPAATATAKTINVPVITHGAASASGFNAINVPFTVNGNGSATSCTIALNGGAPGSFPCTGGKHTGLLPATTYNFTVTASNKAGSASFSGAATTPTISGTVVCTDDSYCGHGSSTGGIWVYKTPNQTKGNEVGAKFAPAVVQVQCYTTGETVDAGPYGGRTTSQWLRIPFNGNNYIPYAWVNLDSGATIGNLPKC
ncbi:MAG TPA: fibronectin type III domain-containing protein [Rugosimonospora sp.]